MTLQKHRDRENDLTLVETRHLGVRFTPVQVNGKVYETWQETDTKWYARRLSGIVVVPGARSRDQMIQALESLPDDEPVHSSAAEGGRVERMDGMYVVVPTQFVKDNPFQPREHYPEEAVIAKALSMRALLKTRRQTLGLIHPPVARLVDEQGNPLEPSALSEMGLAEGRMRVQLADGHVRLRGARLSAKGFEATVDDGEGKPHKRLEKGEKAHESFCVDLDSLTDRQMAEIAAEENSHRLDLTWWETAGGMNTFMTNFHATQGDVAPMYGLNTSSAVSQYTRARSAIEAFGNKYLSGLAREDRLPLKTALALVPLIRDYPDAATEWIGAGNLLGEDGEVKAAREIDDLVKAEIKRLNRGTMTQLSDPHEFMPDLDWRQRYMVREDEQRPNDETILLVEAGRYYVAFGASATLVEEVLEDHWSFRARPEQSAVVFGASDAKAIEMLLDAGYDVVWYEETEVTAVNQAVEMYAGPKAAAGQKSDRGKKPGSSQKAEAKAPGWWKEYQADEKRYKGKALMYTISEGEDDPGIGIAFGESAAQISKRLRAHMNHVNITNSIAVYVIKVDLSDEDTWDQLYAQDFDLAMPSEDGPDSELGKFLASVPDLVTYNPPLSDEEKQAKVAEKMAGIFPGAAPQSPPDSAPTPPAPTEPSPDVPDIDEVDTGNDPLAQRLAEAALYLKLAFEALDVPDEQIETDEDRVIVERLNNNAQHAIVPLIDITGGLADIEVLNALRTRLSEAEEGKERSTWADFMFSLKRSRDEAVTPAPKATQRDLFNQDADEEELEDAA